MKEFSQSLTKEQLKFLMTLYGDRYMIGLPPSYIGLLVELKQSVDSCKMAYVTKGEQVILNEIREKYIDRMLRK